MSESETTGFMAVLAAIAADTATDAAAFEGQPFTGQTVGEYMGNHGAAIAWLANILGATVERLEQAENALTAHCANCARYWERAS